MDQIHPREGHEGEWESQEPGNTNDPEKDAEKVVSGRHLSGVLEGECFVWDRILAIFVGVCPPKDVLAQCFVNAKNWGWP
jgi:hypothetical protein